MSLKPRKTIFLYVTTSDYQGFYFVSDVIIKPLSINDLEMLYK